MRRDPKIWSGRRESNPRNLLGRQMHYRCATPANLVGVTGLEPAASTSQTSRATNCATPRSKPPTLNKIFPSAARKLKTQADRSKSRAFLLEILPKITQLSNAPAKLGNDYPAFEPAAKNATVKMMKKRVFSGIQPSGSIHIGNYLGAISRWVKMQDEYDCIFCIVDLHAITVPQDPRILKSKIRELAALYLAAGIDPKKSIIFVQSHVPAHTELAWLLNCIIPMGWMERMTQFKEKAAKNKERTSVGLFDYPALMAADILLYQTDAVPVGEDQVQHIELARDAANRFNKQYGQVFKAPEALVSKSGARIMSLDDPTKKMSKSESSKKHAVYLLDDEKEIKAKIMSATTDSKTEIVFDPSRPGIYNLLTIYQLFSGLDKQKIEARFKDKNYNQFKNELSNIVIEALKPIRANYTKITKEKNHIDTILKEGAAKAALEAEKTLYLAKKNLGLV